MKETVEDWKLYEDNKRYNNNIINPNDISYYEMIDLCLSFFSGNQWKNVKSEKLPKPVFNYIKRGITFFIASIMSNNISVTFENIEHLTDDTDDMVTVINAEIKNILEKWKIENRVRDLLFDAAITGDMAIHTYFDAEEKVFGGTGKINLEMIDGSNIMVGNPSVTSIENQPYVIIVGRDIAKNLQEEAKQYKNNDTIESDNDYDLMPGDNGKIEIESDKYGKALYIIVYRRDKKTGTIKVSKLTKDNYIYKDIDTGLKYYPVVFGNWEKQKNTYHGKGAVIDMVPNQIAINKMFSMVIYHLMLTAFPSPIYNKDKLGSWSNELGSAIAVTDLAAGENIKNLAGYIEPSQMSGYIITAIDNAIRYTKECMGISDASLGGIDPKNATAIIAVQKSAVVPLENVKANLFEFIEDLGRVLLDMIGTKYGTREIIIEADGVKQRVSFDFNSLKDKWLEVKANVGSSAYFSELASMQTLDNLLTAEKITFLQYLERLPDNMIPKKDELIAAVKEQMGLQAQQQQMLAEQQGLAEQGQIEAQYEQMAQYVSTLPEEVQAELKSLPDKQMEQVVIEMMSKDPNLNANQAEVQQEQQSQSELNDMIRGL